MLLVVFLNDLLFDFFLLFRIFFFFNFFLIETFVFLDFAITVKIPQQYLLISVLVCIWNSHVPKHLNGYKPN